MKKFKMSEFMKKRMSRSKKGGNYDRHDYSIDSAQRKWNRR